jgi:RHS repeat-associated protein
MFFDNNLNLVPEYSGVQRVTEAGSLQKLAVMNQKMPTDGFYYTYVTNQSAQLVQTDNFTYIHIEGVLKEATDYYPYGLLCSSATIASVNTSNNYKFQDKEFNRKEFVNTWGLDWYNHGARMYDPELGRWHVQDPALQFANPYLAMGNNPVMYTDPDGRFITWSISKGGLSIGFNLSPTGIPLGAGLNLGWGSGFSTGVYGEVGYRFGGNIGLGAGVGVTQSLDYNWKYKNLSTTTTEFAYASLGPFNAGVSVSQTYDITNKQWTNSWGVSAGVGVGNGKNGIGLFVGYGSNGWNYGLNGYHVPKIELPKYNVILEANDDGSYSEKLSQNDFMNGKSENREDYTTNLVNNPNVKETINSDGDFVYEIKSPRKFKITAVQAEPSEARGVLSVGSETKGTYTITSLNRMSRVTLLGSRPYSGNIVNFRNYNYFPTNNFYNLLK